MSRPEPVVPSMGYVIDLAKKNSEALSFIPTPKLMAYAACGQLRLAYEEGEPCGFLVFGHGWPRLKIYQACIATDARRREHGLAMVHELITSATTLGYESISCWCASDLEANRFWPSAGFQWVGHRMGGRRRGRIHHCWIYELDQPCQGRLLWTNERD